ncbi:MULTISPECIES: hypothetical protein [unclassified Sutcliffiella]|uniref:hypothetical protein n=1 Tax=unclassified Sutcliffiella TaxID=2837532 RepID=UPI0030D3E38B
MNFDQGVTFMSTQSATIKNTGVYSNKLHPVTDYMQLIVFYPGRKGRRDYKVEHNGSNTTHVDIVLYLYDLALQNNSTVLVNFILDVYNNGLYSNHAIPLNMNRVRLNGVILTVEQFKHILFWVALQEDINYPRPKKQGVRLPFKRYLEAITSAYHPNVITLNQVIKRTNNHHGSVPVPINVQQLPVLFSTALTSF